MTAADRLRWEAWLLRWRRLPRAGSRLRLATARLTHGERLRIGPNVYAGPDFRLEMPTGRLTIGPGVMLRRGFYCEISGEGSVRIGAGTNFSGQVTVQCSSSVEIGENCMIATALIADGSHEFRDPERPARDQGYRLRSVQIGDAALIHNFCTIVANVGEHAVIGANSLVNRDVPAYCLAGGVPARVIEYFGPPGQGPAGVPERRRVGSAG